MHIDKRCALIIVDMQNDFCENGTLEVPQARTILPTINALSPKFPVCIATKDWHPQNHISFASNHPGKSVLDTVEATYGTQVVWPDHCVQGSAGAEFHPQLDVKPLKAIIHKGCNPHRDSYSAFFESDNSTVTGLDGYLRGLAITTVYVCGLATDYCVQFTALGANRLSYHTYVIQDAVLGIDSPTGSVAKAIDDMQAVGITLLNASDLTFVA